MKFWNDQLRICPKCKSAVNLVEELRGNCPKCGSQVWFFNYRPAPPLPELPQVQPSDLWKNPTTTLLLVGAAFFGLVALVGVSSKIVLAVVSGAAALGFAVFGFIRHAETRRIEQGLEHSDEIRQYAETMRERVKELTARYNYLLKTGDQRIEQYYNETYVQAVREQEEARRLLQRAQVEREAVKRVEDRIYAMAKRLVDDHRKWSTQKLRADPENYQRRRLELEKTFSFVESIGYGKWTPFFGQRMGLFSS